MKRNPSDLNKNKNNQALSLRDRKRLKQQVTVQSGSTSNEGNSRTISVNQFVQARGLEIQSLEKAIKNASQFTGTQRVFQTVPRFMRRRAASYNVKRLPKRLRQKAKEQMDRDPEPPKKLLSRRARRRPARMFQERVSSSMWMETHVWHAKRMKMVKKWGLKIAQHANMKNQRSLYRAAKHTVTAMDVSYLRVIEIAGPTLDIILERLRDVTDPSFPSVGSAKYTRGGRQGNGFLHEKNAFPQGAICPYTFLWNKSVNGTVQLWLWIHLSTYKVVLDLLQALFQDCNEVQVNHLGTELNRFELRGPRSHAVLQHAFTLADTTHPLVNNKSHEIWKNLSHLPNPAILPQGTVFSLTVLDPRLGNVPVIPPRSALGDNEARDLENTLFELPSLSAALYESQIWSSETRQLLSEHTKSITESDINKRKSESLIPGTPLEPTETDARIPILLISRGPDGENIPHEKKTSTSATPCFASGWDMIIPKGWALPFWRVLAKCGVQHGGIRDRRQHGLENGYASFPHDFSETNAFCEDLKIEAEAKLAHHLRIPPGKRVNYAAHRTHTPFSVDFTRVAKVHGLVKSDYTLMDVDKTITSRELVIPPLDPVPVVHSQNLVRVLGSYLKSWSQTTNDINSSFAQFCNSVSECMIAKNLIPNKPQFVFGEWLHDMFVRVRITPIQEGDVHDFAMLYYPPTSDVHYKVGKSSDPLKRQFSIPEGEKNLIGYITTGGYSLNSGCCTGIGAIPLKCVFEMTTSSPEHSRNVLLFRNTTSPICRLAECEIIC